MFLKGTNKLVSRLGLRTQLVLLCVGVFGAFFSLFSAAVFIYIAKTYQKQFDSALYNYVIDVSHSIDFQHLSRTHPPLSVLADSEMILPFSIGETLLQVVDLQGRVLLKSKSLENKTLPFSVASKSQLSQEKAVFQEVRLPFFPGLGTQASYRMVSHLARGGDEEFFVVQAAVPNILLEHQKEALVTFFSVSVPLMLLLSAFFGLEFSGRAMAPVSAIIAKANEIEAKHLSEEIPVPESGDEIRDLAITLNGLLRRLEKAFRLQEGFVADASHQLKTPLAILKGELELFRKGEKTPEKIDSFVRSAAQEIDYLSKMVEDLLTLARMDAESRIALAPVPLDERLLDCVARFERASKSRGIRFSVQLKNTDPENTARPFELAGESELLRSLIENLLDNAVKYTPLGGVVQVTLSDCREALTLCIEDSGPGLPVPIPERLYERFFRAESTQDVVPGSGLGLSIVKRIADLHGGSIRFSNRTQGGARFEVVFPRKEEEIKTF
jgi:signal transduction histidine kinase